MVLIKSSHKLLTRLQFRNCMDCFTSQTRLLSSQNFRGKWIKSTEGNPGVMKSVVDIEPAYNQTITEFLSTNLHKFENPVAFECILTGRKYTHKEVHRKSKSFAVTLKQMGLHKHESVCILLPNIPEYPIITLGAIDAGLLVSPINPSYTPQEVAKQVNDSDGAVIVTIPQLLPIVQAIRKSCPTLKSVIIVGEPHEGCHSFFEMVKADSSSTKLLKGSDINCITETVILPYSSGTTGVPKGVELTHSTFTTNIKQITFPGYRQTDFFENGNAQEKIIGLMPFFHLYGLQIIMSTAMYQGAHTLCVPKFEPALFVQAIRQHKPTVLHLVTPLINFMLGCKEITNDDLQNVKGIIAGAAPIGITLIEKFIERFDHYVFFQEGYGMTELSSVCHQIPPELKNTMAGSSGVLIPGTSCKIVDNDSGDVVGPGETGEICIRGPQVMKGYYKNQDATSESFDAYGFMKTGDIGYADEQGFLYIVDRLKELIKVKGLQVAPAELENILRKHPEVADVAVIGVPHDKLGECPRAYVVPKSKSLTEESVKSFLEGNVAPHKKLVGGVEFVDAIPKAPSGKILRRILKKAYIPK